MLALSALWTTDCVLRISRVVLLFIPL